METIRPSSDLRNHYSEISKQCHEEGTPVIITVNGRGDTAVLGLFPDVWQHSKIFNFTEARI